MSKTKGHEMDCLVIRIKDNWYVFWMLTKNTYDIENKK